VSPLETLRRKPVIWGALAWASILESVRRKDIYVALILAGLMIAAASAIGTFGVEGLELFLKDVALTVISLLSTLMAVLFASRQIPEELSRRTVYPLLARPISRGDLIFGKWLGAFALSAVSLVGFALLAAGLLGHFGLGLGAIFTQFVLLRLFALGIVCAMTLCLSLVLTPGANITVSLLLAVGSSTIAGAAKLLYPTADGPGQALWKFANFALPQFQLFDLGKKVSYGWKPIPTPVVGQLFAYAALFSALFLVLGALRFRRQAL
jgi:ABC-type transport system involved in multi-copper enzyme maturation permease subunit